MKKREGDKDVRGTRPVKSEEDNQSQGYNWQFVLRKQLDWDFLIYEDKILHFAA